MCSASRTTLITVSRGHGRLQSFILEGVTRNSGQAYPVPVLARWCARQTGVEETPHLRASVRRAVNRLAAEEAVELADVLLPTRVLADGRAVSRRWITCVASRDTAWTDAVHDSAKEWMRDYLAADLRAAAQGVAEAPDGSLP